MLMETERLYMRQMVYEDLPALKNIMQDEINMKAAYEGIFSDEEITAWIGRHIARYEKLGFGLWAVVLKETGELIGQCGITLQQWENREMLEIGYLFARCHSGKGYATEAAAACRDYAFYKLGAHEVCSMIRDSHIASQRVAERIGMKKTDEAVKNFRGVDMNFYLYTARK